MVDDLPLLMVDDVALRLCRSLPASPLDYQLAQPGDPVLAAARFSACVRSRFATNALRASGLSQCVLLGAGLDHPVGEVDDVAWWAVDLPDVLAWRTDLYQQAGLADRCIHVPANLTTAHLVDALTMAGLDASQPVMVAWLGGTMYVPEAAVHRVCDQLGILATGSVLVADIVEPPAHRDQAGQAYADAITQAVGGREPWRCQVSPDNLAVWLQQAGWQISRSIPEAEAVPAGFWHRHDSLTPMRLIQLIEAHT